MTVRQSSLLLLAALALSGCKPDAAVKKAEIIDSAATKTQAGASTSTGTVDSTQFGNVHGTISFTGKLPARVPIDMSMDPACAMAKEPNLSEQYIVDKGKLANVFVYIKAGIAPSMAPDGTPAVVLDQKGCRYAPHVVAIQQGGSVEFRNSDPTMHNIHTASFMNPVSNSTDVSQGPMGDPATRQFTGAENMLPIRCNNHPWMNAFLNIAPNPYFAITAADGTFTIPNLPPGSYTLAAVHEKSGEQDVQITVSAKVTTKADFAFTAK